MEELGFVHTASVTPWVMLGTTASRTNREVSTGRCSTSLIFKCIVLANTRQVLTRGKENPKDLTCCCNSRSFFFHNPTQSWWAWNDEPSTSTLELHTRLRNTLEGTSALAISVLPPSPCRETLKHISRGTDEYDKWKYWKSRRNYAILANNVSTYSDMFPSPNHVSSNVQTIACLECAARTSRPFYLFVYFCFSFICRTNTRQSGTTRTLCFTKHGLGTCRSYYVTPSVSLKVVLAGFRCESFTQ